MQHELQLHGGVGVQLDLPRQARRAGHDVDPGLQGVEHEPAAAIRQGGAHRQPVLGVLAATQLDRDHVAALESAIVGERGFVLLLALERDVVLHRASLGVRAGNLGP